MENNNLPTLEQLQSFLTEYGWHFRVINDPETSQDVIIAPYALNDTQGILVTFSVRGEFVLVSTVGLLGNVSKSYAFDFLCLNDTIKLAKLFAIPRAEADQIDVDLSFELWAESWNQGAFFAFMDMLASDIEKTLDFAVTENIPHDTKYVEFAPKTDEPAAPEEAPAPITE